jgi:hypothetical protein
MISQLMNKYQNNNYIIFIQKFIRNLVMYEIY